MGLISSLKKRGLKNTIKQAKANTFGLYKTVRKQQEQIDTLHYFLNAYADITKLPPTKDENLRNLQLALVEMIRIFDKLCKKHNLQYFLCGGNVIGAVRHKGFIPWDDDVDVTMPREDYDKILPLFKDEMEKYGIVVRSGGYFDNRGPMSRLAFAYKTLETGVWLDIFPLDTLNAKGRLEEIRPELEKASWEYKAFYDKHENKISNEEMLQKKNEIYGKYDCLNNGSHKVMMEFLEFESVLVFHDEDTVFPLHDAEYEGEMFPVPNNLELYIPAYYGNNYMSFPYGGVEHHCDPDGQRAKTRAVRHNVDMKEVIAYLHSVYEKI